MIQLHQISNGEFYLYCLSSVTVDEATGCAFGPFYSVASAKQYYALHHADGPDIYCKSGNYRKDTSHPIAKELLVNTIGVCPLIPCNCRARWGLSRRLRFKMNEITFLY